MSQLLPVPDETPDVSDWRTCQCPTCGSPVQRRQTNLRAVAATGDERVAGTEYRQAQHLEDTRQVIEDIKQEDPERWDGMS